MAAYMERGYGQDNSVSVRSPVGAGAGVRESEMELAAFERGRQQGELEAVHRLEAQGFGNKQMIGAAPVATATANVVEIQHMTWKQRVAAFVGEALSVAYIVLMGVWIGVYRTGVTWDNSRGNGNSEMMNIHTICAFGGLFCASQAYLDYRILPLRTLPLINKLIYITWHILALGGFALSIASAVLAQPGASSQSMHAWTAYLATFAYAAHAIYSSVKVLVTPHRGVSAHNWNETVNVAEQPTQSTWQLTPEQRRDHNLQVPTVYRAAPHWNSWWARRQAAKSEATAASASQYNADGSVAVPVNGAAAAPTWSEETYTAGRFFLVPRKKWAITSLIGLTAVVLTGLGEYQMTLASIGGAAFPASQGLTGTGEGLLTMNSNESRYIGVIGLCTLLGVMAVCYAAMPPRTVVASGSGYGQLPVDQLAGAKRNSISMGATAPNTAMREEVV